MTQTVARNQVNQLQESLSLAHNISTQDEADQAFETVRTQIEANSPEAAEMMQLLWQDAQVARRSAAFWQELCQVEKHLSEKITENHQQLKQDYQKLVRDS